MQGHGGSKMGSRTLLGHLSVLAVVLLLLLLLQGTQSVDIKVSPSASV